MNARLLKSLKTLAVATLLAGVVLALLPVGGCAQQEAEMRVTGTETGGADVATAGDVPPTDETESVAQPTGQKKRTVVTKHGPRRR